AGGNHVARRAAPESTTVHRYGIDVDDLGVSAAVVESASVVGRDRSDAITASPSIKWKSQSGLNPNPFGQMDPKHEFTGLKFKAKKKGTGGTVSLSFNVDAVCTWGTSGPNHTDVTSGSDKAVTAETYKDIVADLTPNPVERSWV